MYGIDEDVGGSREEVPFIATLLLPDAPADELGSGDAGGVDVTSGTELSEDTTKGGVGLEPVLPSVVEVKPFEGETGGVPGAERL